MAKNTKLDRLVKLFREKTKIEMAQTIVENNLDV